MIIMRRREIIMIIMRIRPTHDHHEDKANSHDHHEEKGNTHDHNEEKANTQ